MLRIGWTEIARNNSDVADIVENKINKMLHSVDWKIRKYSRHLKLLAKNKALTFYARFPKW